MKKYLWIVAALLAFGPVISYADITIEDYGEASCSLYFPPDVRNCHYYVIYGNMGYAPGQWFDYTTVRAPQDQWAFSYFSDNQRNIAVISGYTVVLQDQAMMLDDNGYHLGYVHEYSLSGD